MKEPEPAAAAVGEDEALLARLDSAVQEYLLASLRTHQERAINKIMKLLGELYSRFRAALADVARLKSDVEIMLHNARVGGLREEELERERDEARAALSAAEQEKAMAVAEMLSVQQSIVDSYNRATPCSGRNGTRLIEMSDTLALRLDLAIRARAGKNQ